MKNFAIVTDSCGDLGENLREKYGIDYAPMRFSYDDVDVPASLDWEYVPLKDFYDLMRKGKRIKTSQVNAEEFRQKFEEYLDKGEDVLYIACTSALSASYNISLTVRDEMKKKYPDRKIICVDSLNSCLGLGLICIAASKLRAEGKNNRRGCRIHGKKQAENESILHGRKSCLLKASGQSKHYERGFRRSFAS